MIVDIGNIIVSDAFTYETDNKIIILFNNVPQVSGCFNAFKKSTK